MTIRPKTKASRLNLQAAILGAAVSACVMTTLLYRWQSSGGGALPEPPPMKRFNVAALSGAKQSEASAAETVQKTEEVVATDSESPRAVEVVEQETSDSLPEAVESAPEVETSAEFSAPVVELIAEADIPPSTLSMPGGQLVATNGLEIVDPLEVTAGTVFIKVVLNESGKVVSADIIRSGGDAFKDSLILRMVRSLDYKQRPANALKLENSPYWVIAREFDYNKDELTKNMMALP